MEKETIIQNYRELVAAGEAPQGELAALRLELEALLAGELAAEFTRLTAEKIAARENAAALTAEAGSLLGRAVVLLRKARCPGIGGMVTSLEFALEKLDPDRNPRARLDAQALAPLRSRYQAELRKFDAERQRIQRVLEMVPGSAKAAEHIRGVAQALLRGE